LKSFNGINASALTAVKKNNIANFFIGFYHFLSTNIPFLKFIPLWVAIIPIWVNLEHKLN